VFKLELMQHTGSFKARGAFASLLLRDVPPAGVVAASGGNHGIAVAYAAKTLGKPATIFVPQTAVEKKKALIRGYGATLVEAGERYADALEASEAFVKESGAMAVHAYDQRETLLGQGTVGAELEEQAGRVDTVLVAVGGGGLIGGVAAWFAGDAQVIGVEPDLAPTLHRALEAGEPVDVDVGGIAMNSLGARRAGAMMFEIAKKWIPRVLLVSDDAIVTAQKTLWDALRVVAEPGGATALAALLSRQYVPRPGERVAVVVCGANTDAVSFEEKTR